MARRCKKGRRKEGLKAESLSQEGPVVGRRLPEQALQADRPPIGGPFSLPKGLLQRHGPQESLFKSRAAPTQASASTCPDEEPSRLRLLSCSEQTVCSFFSLLQKNDEFGLAFLLLLFFVFSSSSVQGLRKAAGKLLVLLLRVAILVWDLHREQVRNMQYVAYPKSKASHAHALSFLKP